MKHKLKTITDTQTGAEGLDLIAPLWMKLREHHQERSLYFKDQMKQMTWEKRRPDLLKKAETGAMLVHLANDDGTLIGYCVSTVDADKQGEIESIYIEKAYRKQHIGDKFMRTALDWMDSYKVTRKVIGVAVGNEEAFGFYQKYGFYPRVTILRQVDTK